MTNTSTMLSFIVVAMMIMMMKEVTAFGGYHHPCSSKRNVFHQDWKQQSFVVLCMENDTNTNNDEVAEISSSTVNPITEQNPVMTTTKEQPPQQPSMEYMMQAMGTSRRRLLTGGLSSVGIALVGNFLGMTSALLQTIPEDIVERSKLDTYYGRGDYKRFTSDYYTFLLPKNWVADSTLELQKAQMRVRTLDYTMTNNGVSPSSNNMMNLPDAAFGPAGNTMERRTVSGDTNVSILVSKVPPFESLQRTLGTPPQAAEYLLTTFLASKNSNNRRTLVSAYERDDGSYQMEYIIDRSFNNKPSLQAISIIAPSISHDTIITMTIIAPQSDWEKDNTKLLKMANSFRIKK